MAIPAYTQSKDMPLWIGEPAQWHYKSELSPHLLKATSSFFLNWNVLAYVFYKWLLLLVCMCELLQKLDDLSISTLITPALIWLLKDLNTNFAHKSIFDANTAVWLIITDNNTAAPGHFQSEFCYVVACREGLDQPQLQNCTCKWRKSLEQAGQLLGILSPTRHGMVPSPYTTFLLWIMVFFFICFYVFLLVLGLGFVKNQVTIPLIVNLVPIKHSAIR